MYEVMTQRESPSDAELLRRAGRDADAFGVFYDRHVTAVLAYFARRTGCAQTAQDLTAETFAEAFAHRRRYRDTGAPASAWLMSIARHKLARFYERGAVDRRARRRLGIPARAVDDASLERIEELAATAELREQVARGVACLSPALSEAVSLRVVEELPFVEVARRLGCSEAAARTRVSRALSCLHDCLEAS
jgi:RNA polymerase sigma factor (sigma-70 family)